MLEMKAGTTFSGQSVSALHW